MSFRLRLTLFFVLIVVLPMVAVAVLVVQIAGDSATGKTDARLSAGLQTAISLFDQRLAEAQSAAGEIASQPELVAALRSGERARIESVARDLSGRQGLTSLALRDRDGKLLAAAGSTQPAGVASVEIAEPEGTRLATLFASTATVPQYLADVRRLTGQEAAVAGRSGRVTGALPVDPANLPPGGAASGIETDGAELRVVSAPLSGSDGLRVAVFGPVESEGFFASSGGVATALAGFFALALLAIALLTRTLQGQVRAMLEAARRIGGGDFSRELPVVGRDEMAGLAGEFNKMSERLSDQMAQLRRQRVEIERSVQRIGEAFASGLDREALLGILIETAVGACAADYGLVVLAGASGPQVEAGEATEPARDVALAAEHRAWRKGGPVGFELEGAYALASSLGRIGSADGPLGVITVARLGRPFEAAERDVFVYLLGQAETSVENAALHELVSVQAVTDDLTGLANKRAFRDVMLKEAARAERFGHQLSLLILDIDDFKQVNDTYGHPQGDAVLRAIGSILDDESREIDEPARYGGEEFVVALPETDVEGALEVAERIRERIAAEPVARVDGTGDLRVTASLGAATMPGAASNEEELIAAADTALYEAKRGGKNRVCIAPRTDGSPERRGRREPEPAPQGPAQPRRT